MPHEKIWFVTGSGRGLGRAIATAALDAGDRVAATSRNVQAVDDLVRKYGDRVLSVPLDVTRYDQAQAAVGAALARFGRIDVVVNNAGYANLGSVEDTPLEIFREQVETNLFGVVNVTKAVVPFLREQGRGHVINVSSLGGRIANAGLAAYQLSKFAVSGFSIALAAELAPLGVSVTAIEPGGMRTDWAGSSMTVLPMTAPYRVSVGILARLMESSSGQGASDPSKVAAAVRAIVALDEPPTRILLGSDAVQMAAAANAAQTASDHRFVELSRSTSAGNALDPLAAAARGPLAVVRRFLEEVVNGRRPELLDELWAADAVWHGGSMGDYHGLDAIKAFNARGGVDSFSHMHLVIEDVITAGTRVAVRFTNSGTQTGPFMGAPASGKRAEWPGIAIYEVRNGRIAEAWFGEDILGMLLQLGVVSLPAN